METTKFEPAKYLETKEAQAELISEAFGTGDVKFIVHALRTVVAAHSLVQASSDVSNEWETICSLLLAEDDPRLSTILDIFAVIGIALKAEVRDD